MKIARVLLQFIYCVQVHTVLGKKRQLPHTITAVYESFNIKDRYLTTAYSLTPLKTGAGQAQAPGHKFILAWGAAVYQCLVVYE